MSWVKCSDCVYGGNGDGRCKHGGKVKRCTEDIGCCTTGAQIKKRPKMNLQDLMLETELLLRKGGKDI